MVTLTFRAGMRTGHLESDERSRGSDDRGSTFIFVYDVDDVPMRRSATRQA